MISVIVPVYNVSKYLPRCLSSLRTQTCTDFETVLVDDGSTDTSGEICDAYAEEVSMVTVIHKQNGGLATARNAGMEAASGDYFVFLDSDDWLEPNTLEKLTAVLSRHGNTAQSIVYGYHMDYVDSGDTIPHGFPETEAACVPVRDALVEMESLGLFNSACLKVYSAQIIRNAGLRFRKGSEPGEDLLFNCLYFAHVQHCVVLPDIFYHYMNQGETTNSNRYDPRLSEKIEWFISAREELFRALDMTSAQCRDILDRCSYEYRLISIYNAYHGGKMESQRSRRSLLKSVFADPYVQRRMETLRSHPDEQDSYQKIFSILYRSRNAALAECVYSMLFFAKKNLKGLYTRFRHSALN